MEEDSYLSERFEKNNCSSTDLSGKDFELCIFSDCNLSDTNLSNTDFIECEFNNCNLSTVNLNNTGFKDVIFINCKLTGTDFGRCNDFLFSVSFENCLLDYSVFTKNSLQKTIFTDCIIKNANFTESDLTKALFLNCDLLNTIFSRNNLTGTDFKTSYNYSLDPELNTIKKAKFSYQGLAGLLEKYDIIIE